MYSNYRDRNRGRRNTAIGLGLGAAAGLGFLLSNSGRRQAVSSFALRSLEGMTGLLEKSPLGYRGALRSAAQDLGQDTNYLEQVTGEFQKFRRFDMTRQSARDRAISHFSGIAHKDGSLRYTRKEAAQLFQRSPGAVDILSDPDKAGHVLADKFYQERLPKFGQQLQDRDAFLHDVYKSVAHGDYQHSENQLSASAHRKSAEAFRRHLEQVAQGSDRRKGVLGFFGIRGDSLQDASLNKNYSNEFLRAINTPADPKLLENASGLQGFRAQVAKAAQTGPMSRGQERLTDAAYYLQAAGHADPVALLGRLPSGTYSAGGHSFNASRLQSFVNNAASLLGEKFQIPVQPGGFGFQPLRLFPYKKGLSKSPFTTVSAGSKQRELYEANIGLPIAGDFRATRDIYNIGGHLLSTDAFGQTLSPTRDIRFQTVDARHGFWKEFSRVRNGDHVIGAGGDREAPMGRLRAKLEGTPLAKIMDALGLDRQSEHSKYGKKFNALERIFNPKAKSHIHELHVYGEERYSGHPLERLKSILSGDNVTGENVEALLDAVSARNIGNPDVLAGVVGQALSSHPMKGTRGFETIGQLSHLFESGLSDENVSRAFREIYQISSKESLGSLKFFDTRSRFLGPKTKYYGRRFSIDDLGALSETLHSNYETLNPLAGFLGKENPLTGMQRARQILIEESIHQLSQGRSNVPVLEQMMARIGETPSLSAKDKMLARSYIYTNSRKVMLGADLRSFDEAGALISDELRNNKTAREDMISLVESRFGAAGVYHPHAESGVGLYMIPERGGTFSDRLLESFNQNSLDPLKNLATDTLGNVTGKEGLRPGALYHAGFRMNRMLSEYGLGLPDEMLQNPVSIFGNLVLRRYLPVVGAIEGYKYVNHTLHSVGLPGLDDGVANAHAYLQLGFTGTLDALGLTEPLKRLQTLSPGTENYFTVRDQDETRSYLDHGYQPIRKGRFYLLGSHQSFTGGKIGYFLPSWYQQQRSHWQEADNVDLNSDAYWCIDPNQKLLLTTGLKPIKDIQVNDKVFCLDGTQGAVIKVNRRKTTAEDTMISVKVAGTDEPVKLTTQHKVFAIRLQIPAGVRSKKAEDNCLRKAFKEFISTHTTKKEINNCIEEISAGDLQYGDLVLTPCPVLENKDSFQLVDFITDNHTLIDDFIFVKSKWGTQTVTSKKAVSNTISFTYELGRLFGFYLAEGCYSPYRADGSGNRGQISFCFHIRETAYAEEIQGILKSVFNLESTVRYYKNFQVVVASSRAVWELFSLFGKQENKKLPVDFFVNNEDYLQGIYTAYAAGDGHFDGQTLSTTTISPQIHAQMQLILLRLGVAFALTKKYAANRKPAYRINLPVSASRISWLQKCDKVIPCDTKFERNSYGILGNFLFRKIQEIVTVELPEEVYDLTVSPNHSYTLDGFCVHNCHSFLPTPTHPLSPVMALLDPYWREKKHSKDRPTVISGGLIDESNPLSLAVNHTVGAIFKPRKVLRPEYLPKNLEKTLAEEPDQEKDSDLSYAYFNKGGAGEGYTAYGQGSLGKRIIAGVNQAIKEGAGGAQAALSGAGHSYGGGDSAGSGGPGNGIGGPLLSGKPNPLTGLFSARMQQSGPDDLNRVVSQGNVNYQYQELIRKKQHFYGIYGFAEENAAVTLGALVGKREHFETVMQSPGRSYGMERRLYDLELGGLGGDFNEFVRRMVPHHDRRLGEYNPVRNNMPDWIPGDGGLRNLQRGDPYLTIGNNGEQRLPGEAYERLHNLDLSKAPLLDRIKVRLGSMSRGDLYPTLDRLDILANEAPYSPEFKVALAQARAEKMEQGPEQAQITQDRINAALKRSAALKHKLDIHDRNFAREKESREFTIDSVLDPNTFTTKEDNNPLRLAGVRAAGSRVSKESLAQLNINIKEGQKPIEALYAALGVSPGARVRAVFDKDAEYNDNLLHTRNATLYVGNTNINSALLKLGVATEKEGDNTAAGLEARFSPLERLYGRAYEWASHQDNFLATKFMRNRSALEHYLREQVYGTENSSWSSPLQSYVYPTLDAISSRSPALASLTGAFVGSLFGKFAGSVKGGAMAGATLGLLLSGKRIVQEKMSGEDWVPGRVKHKREIEEYYDNLKYVKAQRLYSQESREALRHEHTNVERLVQREQRAGQSMKDQVRELEHQKRNAKLFTDDDGETVSGLNQDITGLQATRGFSRPVGPHTMRALMFRSQMHSTLRGFKRGDSFPQLVSALPVYEREIAQDIIAHGTKKEKRHFYNLLPDNEKSVLGGYLGKKRVPEKENLQHYFSDHTLPGESFVGWREDFNLGAIRTIQAEEEKVPLSELGLFPKNVEDAHILTENIPVPTLHGRTHQIRATLKSVLEGRGVRDVRIDLQVSPSHHSSRFHIDTDLYSDRTQDAAAMM